MLNITDVINKLPRKPGDRNWRTRPLDAITKIVVHYDAVRVPPAYDPVKRYVEQARYHISKNWNEGSGPAVRGFGLMYHYRVSSDGRVWRTQPDELVTWHARRQLSWPGGLLRSRPRANRPKSADKRSWGPTGSPMLSQAGLPGRPPRCVGPRRTDSSRQPHPLPRRPARFRAGLQGGLIEGALQARTAAVLRLTPHTVCVTNCQCATAQDSPKISVR